MIYLLRERVLDDFSFNTEPTHIRGYTSSYEVASAWYRSSTKYYTRDYKELKEVTKCGC